MSIYHNTNICITPSGDYFCWHYVNETELNSTEGQLLTLQILSQVHLAQFLIILNFQNSRTRQWSRKKEKHPEGEHWLDLINHHRSLGHGVSLPNKPSNCSPQKHWKASRVQVEALDQAVEWVIYQWEGQWIDLLQSACLNPELPPMHLSECVWMLEKVLGCMLYECVCVIEWMKKLWLYMYQTIYLIYPKKEELK